MQKPSHQDAHDLAVTSIYSFLNGLSWTLLSGFLIYKYIHADRSDKYWFFLLALSCSLSIVQAIKSQEKRSSQSSSTKWYAVGLHGPLTLAFGLPYLAVVYALIFLKKLLAFINTKRLNRTKPVLPKPKDNPLAALKEPLADLEQAMSSQQPPVQGAYRNQSAEDALLRLKEAYKRASEK